MSDKEMVAAVRSEPTNDIELIESLQSHGWNPDLPAVQDENGVIIVGNRRMRIAKKLGIKPVIVTLVIGTGEEADLRRASLAELSNVANQPISKRERQNYAIYLANTRDWSQAAIAKVIGVSQMSVSRYLEGVNLNRVFKSNPKTATNPKGAGRRKSPPKPEKPHKYPKTTEKKAASLHLDEGKSVSDVSKELGVSEQVVIRSTERERGRREVEEREPLLDPSTLSASAKAKLEAFRRRYQKELDAKYQARVKEYEADYHQRVHDAVVKREEYLTKEELEALATADKVLANRGLMSRAQYNDLLRCLHPDSRKSVSEDMCNRSVQLITELKRALVKEEKHMTAPIPRSREEMLKRREEVRRQREAAKAK